MVSDRDPVRPVGAHFASRLGLLLLLDNGDDEDDGLLQPHKLGENEAANSLQQPQQTGHDKGEATAHDAENKDLHPNDGEEDEAYLPPTRRGDDAVNKDLQPANDGHINVARRFLPRASGDDAGRFQPPNQVVTCLFSPLNSALLQSCMHDGVMLKTYLMKSMHATSQNPSQYPITHVDGLTHHANPRVNPKVKKKTSLLLCITIHTPFHPGEQQRSRVREGVHDVRFPTYPHHELPHLWHSPSPATCPSMNPSNGCEKLPNHVVSDTTLITNDRQHLQLQIYPQVLNMVVAILMHFLSKHYIKIMCPHPLSTTDDPLTLFTLLRGRNSYIQVREKKSVQVQTKQEIKLKLEVQTVRSKMKTKDFMLLIIQAILDPG